MVVWKPIVVGVVADECAAVDRYFLDFAFIGLLEHVGEADVGVMRAAHVFPDKGPQAEDAGDE